MPPMTLETWRKLNTTHLVWPVGRKQLEEVWFCFLSSKQTKSAYMTSFIQRQGARKCAKDYLPISKQNRYPCYSWPLTGIA